MDLIIHASSQPGLGKSDGRNFWNYGRRLMLQNETPCDRAIPLRFREDKVTTGFFSTVSDSATEISGVFNPTTDYSAGSNEGRSHHDRGGPHVYVTMWCESDGATDHGVAYSTNAEHDIFWSETEEGPNVRACS